MFSCLIMLVMVESPGGQYGLRRLKGTTCFNRGGTNRAKRRLAAVNSVLAGAAIADLTRNASVTWFFTTIIISLWRSLVQ